jgi:hypothetical protein
MSFCWTSEADPHAVSSGISVTIVTTDLYRHNEDRELLIH